MYEVLKKIVNQKKNRHEDQISNLTNQRSSFLQSELKGIKDKRNVTATTKNKNRQTSFVYCYSCSHNPNRYMLFQLPIICSERRRW